jgi:hypothetical protein
LSMCQPIPAPGPYSVTSSCCNCSGCISEKAAAGRSARRKSGMSSVFLSWRPEKL